MKKYKSYKVWRSDGFETHAKETKDTIEAPNKKKAIKKWARFYDFHVLKGKLVNGEPSYILVSVKRVHKKTQRKEFLVSTDWDGGYDIEEPINTRKARNHE